MNIYNYNTQNKEYTNSQIANIDPLESKKGKVKYLIPKSASFKNPLEIKEGFAICFNEDSQEWEYFEDNRGPVFNKHEALYYDLLGALPSNLSKTKPELTIEEANQIKVQEEINRDEEIRISMVREADPLFFKWQAGEGDKQDWLDKRAEVKARFQK